VVGVATLTAEEGQNLNFARSSHDLWNFLQTIDQDTKPKALSEKKDQILSDPDFIAAREANDRGDGAAALKLVNTLQQRYRNEPRLLFQFAYAYETLGLHDEAYRSWRAYIDIDPTDPAAWRHFAIAAANLNRISEAINAYKQTLKMKPDADTWRLLGDLYDAQGQYAVGVQAHDEADKLGGKKKTASSPASTAAQTQRNSRPSEAGSQKLTRVYVKKYGVSALLPTDVFPDAKKLSNSDQSFLQGNSWTGQTTLTFSSVREPLAKVYAECATEHSPQAPSKTVQYKVLKPTWFVVSGNLGPEADFSLGFYTKGVKKDSSIVIMHFQYREDDFPFSDEAFTAMSRGFDGH
jgi:tetratricopeptide (TPR) repeat protein